MMMTKTSQNISNVNTFFLSLKMWLIIKKNIILLVATPLRHFRFLEDNQVIDMQKFLRMTNPMTKTIF